MRTEQLEAWVLQLVDQASNGSKIEDSRVELKADWPEPQKAARRIAGHANAAGTDFILWVIGLDERQGVVAVTPTDLAEWLPKVEAWFERISPRLTDLVIPTGPSIAVTALLFDVSRRPFVVRNPAAGTPGGGPVSLEVPWREGTRIESARRDQLLRLLVPRLQLPDVEILNVGVSVTKRDSENKGEQLCWSFDFSLYVTPRSDEMVVFPVHKASINYRTTRQEPFVAADQVQFSLPQGGHIRNLYTDSMTIGVTRREAVVSGPGTLYVHSTSDSEYKEISKSAKLNAELRLRQAGSEIPIVLQRTLEPAEPRSSYRRWSTKSQI